MGFKGFIFGMKIEIPSDYRLRLLESRVTVTTNFTPCRTAFLMLLPYAISSCLFDVTVFVLNYIRLSGVTGNALLADIDTFLAAGADDVFTKPMDLARFNTYMQRACGGR